jgi:hypothetical protein
MEIFIEYITKRIQNHIGQSIGKIVKTGNRRLTILDEHKLKNKANNVIRLSNGEEIRTENVEEINSNVIKAEMSAVMLRSVTGQYQVFYDTFVNQSSNDEIDQDIIRYRSALASNLRGGLTVLGNEGISSKVNNNINSDVYQYSDWDEAPNFDYGVAEEEISCIAENIIEKLYREWMAKEKTKIRYNFAEDAKRTWNRIKQTADRRPGWDLVSRDLKREPRIFSRQGYQA